MLKFYVELHRLGLFGAANLPLPPDSSWISPL